MCSVFQLFKSLDRVDYGSMCNVLVSRSLTVGQPYNDRVEVSTRAVPKLSPRFLAVHKLAADRLLR